MNWKTWAPLVLAIVLGVVAAKAARDVMLSNKAAANNSKFTKVVVPRGDVQPGAALTSADLTMAQVDSARVPATSFDSADKLVGRVSETLMIKGQPIVEAMLAPVGSGSGLQALVPPGMRAVTMEVNESSGLAGLISPGCRVDVIATLNDGHNNNESRIAKTIVQNVKVSAVGQRTSSGGTDAPTDMFKSVTILASLEDAEALELACAMGRPRLVLRGGRDNEVTATAGVSMNDLKGTGGRPDTGTSALAVATPTTAPVAVVTPPPPPPTKPVQTIVQAETVKHRLVRVIKGGRVSMVSLTLDADQDDSDSDSVAGKSGHSRDDGDSDDAVGTTSDPFDSK